MSCEEIWLVNYCHPALEPLKSITSLPEAESFRVAREISQGREGACFGRFGPDYRGYYPHRMRAEAWLYEEFLKIGGRPETRHPYYFVLKGSELLKNWFAGGVVSRLRLADARPAHISFTYGDSHSMLLKPNRRAPIAKEALLAEIARFGGVDAFLASVAGEFTYMEAQLWSNAYMEKIVKEISNGKGQIYEKDFPLADQ